MESDYYNRMLRIRGATGRWVREGGGNTVRQFARFRIKLIGKHCTTGRDGTRNCDEGTGEGRGREGPRGQSERARKAGELAKINIPYRAIASDNVDDRPELA